MSTDRSEYKKYDDLRNLILRALDGTITCEEISALENMLISDENNRKYYRAFMFTYCNIESIMGADNILPASGEGKDDSNIDKEFLSILAEQEDNAPELIIEKPAEILRAEPQVEQTVKPNRFVKLFNVAISAAAVLLFFFIVYANVFPPQYSVPVASVSDYINVQWQDKSEELEIGDRILTNQPPYSITDGIVKLNYEKGIDVVIEGPAQFQIMADDKLKLDYGRAYAIVSETGYGFSILTDNTRVIDLGTEFGVQVDSNGDTSIHVTKGKTMLVAGQYSDNVSMEVSEGIAKKVSARSNSVADIFCKEEFFVRDINSSNNFIWRGQDKICLADIVGGGNGFGTGKDLIAIDPASGKISNEIETNSRFRKDNKYFPVDGNTYIDGVFVPYGGDNTLTITSEGHIFDECPETEGKYWMGISNKPVTNPDVSQKRPTYFEYVKLDGIQYGTNNHPAIMMHANCGITFDLNSIRQINKNKQIVSFNSIACLSDTVLDTDFNEEVTAVLWVLVDGIVRQKIALDIKGINKALVEVELNNSDRFLTLISTDNNKSINFDWTFFGEPSLMLE